MQQIGVKKMDKIFTYSNSVRDKDVKIFKALNPELHKELLRLISRNPINGYVVDKGSSIATARYAADEIARFLIRSGWSLGI